jgi:DNA (cytosine-5)-methyltransferase 1
MKALSLFSGIGGIDLACEWVGIETVAFCEREPFCQKVLQKHWPQVPIYDDVCTLTKERLEADGIETIELIHGGYPCQPFSIAGEQRGTEDDRYLWPEIRRLLQEIKPKWFIGENVANHISLGLDEVLSDLESCGYTWETFVIPAIAVNAPHRRDRVFIAGIISDTGCIGHQGNERFREDEEKIRERRTGAFRTTPKLFDDVDWKKRARESGFLGGNYGIPNRLDRIRACGNAVSPYQIYPILAAIKQIDDMLEGVSA